MISLESHLHNEVSSHANDEEDDEANDLGEDTDLCGVGDEGNHKAKGLPHSIVGEGSFLIRSKETTIESIDLSLPDSISQAPETSQDVDNIYLVKQIMKLEDLTEMTYLRDPGSPGEHDDDDGDVHEGSEHEECGPSHHLDDVSTGKGEGGIAHSEHDDHATNDMSTVGTGHETLKIFRSSTHETIKLLLLFD